MLSVVVLLSGYFMATSPVAFQKSSTIKFVEESMLIPPEPKTHIDIRPILEKISYKGGMVYEIQPKQKYIKTVKQGYGNCSNLAFGLAYCLRKQNHECQIVHLLPPAGYLNGAGHTVVNAPYAINGENHYGIVDVFEGGLLQDNDRFVDVNTLRKAKFGNPSILSLNPNSDDKSVYYGEFLDKAIIGIIKSDEIDTYFDFIDNIYVPLGNKKIEKMFYDGLAIVFGCYPNIYVLKDDSDALLRGNKVARLLSNVLLFSIRAFLSLIVFLIAAHIFIWAGSRKTRFST